MPTRLKSKCSGISFCLLLMLFLTGCNSRLISNEKRIAENVMNKGDRITVFNDYGELTITAGNDNKRYLTVSGTAPRTTGWLGDTVSIRLNERKKRYNGSLGLYCATNVREIRMKNGGGPTKVEIEEAQLHFETIDDVEKWLECFKSFDKGFQYNTWSSDGLYIQWHFYTPEYWFFPTRTVLDVLVFQIYVGGDKVSPYPSENGIRYWYGNPEYYSEVLNTQKPMPIYVGGQKPSNLPDAQDDKIKVEQVDDEQLQKLKKSIRWF